MLNEVVDMMTVQAQRLLLTANETGDNRLLRAHLILEEAAETMEALLFRDEVKLMDALADLYYVTLGTAVSYSLPLSEAFWEVHRSNMTKRANAQAGGLGQDRVEGNNAKDADGFTPPDLKSVLARARKRSDINLTLDGDKWCATRPDFEDLATSLAGFGETQQAAIENLKKQEATQDGTN